MTLDIRAGNRAPRATLKSRFVAILVMAQLGILGVAAAGLWSGSGGGARGPWCWVAPAVASVAFLAFLAWLMRAHAARTAPHLPWLMGPSYAALALAAACVVAEGSAALPAALLAALGGLGNWLYVHWYSKLDRPAGSRLIAGRPLPAFRVRNLRGEVVESTSWLGRPGVLLFYRGNWCPLCSAQVAELAMRYQDLERQGVCVRLVSPQPAAESAALASRFDAPMEFLIDEGGHAARALGIWHLRGVPFGVFGYGSDTVFPTAVITDAAGTVIFCDQTDNYRVRPEPDTFLAVLGGMAPGRPRAAEGV